MLISLKNDVNEIARLCDEVKKFCEENGVSDEKYHDIVLILDEIVTNVINYAYPDGGTHTFTLDLRKEGDDRISMKLSDDGIPFDPLARDNPDTESSLEERQIGGLGIFIVKQLSEVVEYSRTDDKNHLSVTVSILNNNNQQKQ
ncbi:MAG: ATP-binding protein [Alphaproteobacteria bacterium]|nr:ATP-binding protein [Alphaproteobacteria bacterium]